MTRSLSGCTGPGAGTDQDHRFNDEDVLSLAVAAAFTVDVLTQPAQPTQAVQLSRLYDVRFPSTVSQCQPALIYRDTPESYAPHIYAMESGVSRTLIRLTIPRGIGYLEWICNIPTGHTFVVLNSYAHVLSDQPGSSSACLGNITATYAYVDYETTAFRSYTAHPANPTAPDIAAFHGLYAGLLSFIHVFSPSFHFSSTSFPTGSFTTITLKYETILDNCPHDSSSHLFQ